MKCVHSAQIRAMEKLAVSRGIPEYELMLRAGRNAARWIKWYAPEASRFVILCGKGNNGGDALVAATELSRNSEVVIFSTVEKSEFHGCAALAVRDLPESIPFYAGKIPEKNDFLQGDVIVDGLLGIGFNGEMLRSEVAGFIAVANGSGLPIVALDLPSGLNSDSGKGAVNGVVKADITLTFGGVKTGLLQNDGINNCGRLRLIDIGLPDNEVDDNVESEAFTNVDAFTLMPDFRVDCHKNSRGRVLVWGASPEYPGAAALTVSGALKSGSGIVRCASEADLSNRLCNAAIFSRLEKGGIPYEFMEKSDVLVCGCGWGSCASASNIRAALEFPGKVVLDADALNFISGDPVCWRKRPDVIITPHPGEAGRLMEAFGIIASPSRVRNASALADELGVTVILKGHGSVVAAPGRKPVIVTAGNALLATAGSGDVLAGIVGSMSAMGLDCFEAASLAAYIHAVAGENAAGVLIADELPELVSRIILRLQHKQFI